MIDFRDDLDVEPAIIGPVAGLLAEWGMIGGRFPMLTAAVGVMLAAALWPRRPIDETGEMARAESR